VRVFRNTTASRTTLASLGALYVLVVALTVVLINRILVTPPDFDLGFAWVLVVFGGLFALGLVAAVAVSILRLLRDRHQGRPGSGFKGRLTGFFALVVFLAAVPQGIVSVSFLASGFDVIFQSETSQAISNGLAMAIDYYDESIRELRVLSDDGTIDEVLSRRLADTLEADDEASRQIWPEIVQRIPSVEAVQVFDRAGDELLVLGDREFARRSMPSFGGIGNQSSVTRGTLAGVPALQLVSPTAEEPASVVVVTARVPERLEQTARSLTDAQELFARFERLRSPLLFVLVAVYGVFATPILLLSILAGFFLSDRIMRPIEALEDATRRVAEGDYSVRILTRPGDDLGVLVVSFNRMVTELDRTRRRMAQAEKVQAWQEIAQRLAHEVKNPLTPIKLAAERLQRRYQAQAEDFGDVLDRTVSTITREVDALTALLNEFRSFSRMPEPQFDAVQIPELLREVADVYRDNPSVSISLAGIPDDLSISADRGQLRQIFVNLITNAVEAAGGSVSIVVSAHEVQRGRQSICRIRVEDDGPGIPEDLRASLFEPYVTSKNRGTGLGLAIVERIVFDHDGRISCESAPGSGTTFVVDLPVEQAV
jgi:nitrogen fixation/metabolism regulation signal transduction histidine kinase